VRESAPCSSVTIWSRSVIIDASRSGLENLNCTSTTVPQIPAISPSERSTACGSLAVYSGSLDVSEMDSICGRFTTSTW